MPRYSQSTPPTSGLGLSKVADTTNVETSLRGKDHELATVKTNRGLLRRQALTQSETLGLRRDYKEILARKDIDAVSLQAGARW